MFGNGYVWLMKDLSSTHNLRILCTYNAGSPLPNAHARRQSTDMATSPSPLSSLLSQPQNRTGSFGNHSANAAEFHNGALKALPILCLKVWEHQWLPDYGITGKEAYVKNWWGRIDWDEVQNLYNLVPENSSELYHMARRHGVDGGRRREVDPLARVAQRSMPM